MHLKQSSICSLLILLGTAQAPAALFTRAGFSYQAADQYYGGQNSFAETVFRDLDGEYTFFNYTLDLAYVFDGGLYVAGGIYATDGEVVTNGLGLGIPNTDSGIKARELPLAVGYETEAAGIGLRFEVRYTINVDDDFNVGFNRAISDAVILPVTDGADTLTLSLRAKGKIGEVENILTIGYRFFEEDVDHPIFPKFSLGDQFYFDYELGYVVDRVRFFAGHLVSVGQRTKGDLSPVTGTAYLTEKPFFLEVRGGAQVAVSDQVYLDAGASYYYDGEDTPKQRTFFVGGGYLF
ncbi:MAG: hypothetical protein ACFCU4_06135 [Puniceicoccaceae bacterium]